MPAEIERLPGESATAFRDRIIPGHREARQERTRRRRRAANLTESRRVKRNAHSRDRKKRRKTETAVSKLMDTYDG